jgi:hypothetical protein
MKRISLIEMIFCGIILFFVILIANGGAIDPDNTKRVLSEQGYTEIEITGWRPWMKSKSDTFSTGFKAKSPSGHIVTGAVTSGFLKGNTIRLD